MTEWIYFIHPPRDDFAATMTAEEETVWAERSGYRCCAGETDLRGRRHLAR